MKEEWIQAHKKPLPIRDSDIENIVRKYALQNFLKYNGEEKSGIVLGRIMSERKGLRQQAKMLKNYVEKEVEKTNNLAKENGIEYIRNLLTRENRESGQGSPYRERNIQDNLDDWKKND